jgi:hypothetical protein
MRSHTLMQRSRPDSALMTSPRVSRSFLTRITIFWKRSRNSALREGYGPGPCATGLAHAIRVR